MRRVATLVFAVAFVLAMQTSALADPVQHFGTFRVQCGPDLQVLVGKPGSSPIVSVNGQSSTSVNILMGLTIAIDGVVVFAFHKPFTEHQQVTICTGLDEPPGVSVVAETLVTPRN
ncbi:MAG: hypothetical protein AUH85_16715 [Chloroflexi bacterium 13_1_40CM_4_68_4]|nr:MAG: hypothetical protein AUH85_16715 [Chloroflexi bacterium 13_1_40CM_4_68_4]